MAKHLQKQVADYLLKGSELDITYNQFKKLINYGISKGTFTKNEVNKLNNWYNEKNKNKLTLQELKHHNDL